MIDPPEDQLAKACYENLLAYKWSSGRRTALNSTLALIHGILLSAGKGEAHNVTDALEELYKGL